MGVAFLGDPQRIADKPLLFLLLVGAVLALDLVRIDIFERATISPATVPTLASAYLFGPLGPIVTEAVILAVRVLRREVAVDGAHRDDPGPGDVPVTGGCCEACRLVGGQSMPQ